MLFLLILLETGTYVGKKIDSNFTGVLLIQKNCSQLVLEACIPTSSYYY